MNNRSHITVLLQTTPISCYFKSVHFKIYPKKKWQSQWVSIKLLVNIGKRSWELTIEHTTLGGWYHDCRLSTVKIHFPSFLNWFVQYPIIFTSRFTVFRVTLVNLSFSHFNSQWIRSFSISYAAKHSLPQWNSVSSLLHIVYILLLFYTLHW